MKTYSLIIDITVCFCTLLMNSQSLCAVVELWWWSQLFSRTTTRLTWHEMRNMINVTGPQRMNQTKVEKCSLLVHSDWIMMNTRWLLQRWSFCTWLWLPGLWNEEQTSSQFWLWPPAASSFLLSVCFHAALCQPHYLGPLLPPLFFFSGFELPSLSVSSGLYYLSLLLLLSYSARFIH